MAAPEVRAVGKVATKTSAISPELPSGTAVGDLLLMFAESVGTESALTASGWTSAPSSPQIKEGTRLTILYRVATGTDPTETNDTGDHQTARIIGIKAGTFNDAEPFNANAGATQAKTKSGSMPSVTSTVNECLIVGAIVGDLPDEENEIQFSGWTNANLESVTERVDNASKQGNGGALGAFSGIKKTSGEVGASTVTAVTEAVRASITLAIAPALAYPEIRAVGGVHANTTFTWLYEPVGSEDGDLWVAIVESGGTTPEGEAINIPSCPEWTRYRTELIGNTRLTVLYRIRAGASTGTIPATGNHQVNRVIGIKKGTFDSEHPFYSGGGVGTQAKTKSGSIEGGKTTGHALVLSAISGNLPDVESATEFSAWTNSSLASVTERMDNTTDQGDGGAIGLASGKLNKAASYEVTTVTAVTEAERVGISIPIAPPGFGEPLGPNTVEGAAHLSGVGASTTQGFRKTSASAAAAGTGALVAIGVAKRSDSANLVGTGSLVASGEVKEKAAVIEGSASLIGQGSLGAKGSKSYAGVAALGGTGFLTGLGIRQSVGSVALSGNGSLTSQGLRQAIGKSSLIGTGQLVAVGEVKKIGKVSGEASLTGTGSLTGVGNRLGVSAASLSGTGSLLGIGGRIGVSGASLTGTGSLVANGEVKVIGKVNGAASLVGVGTLVGSGEVKLIGKVVGSASLSGIGFLSGAGSAVVYGQVGLSGAGSLLVAGARGKATGASLTGTGQLQALGIAQIAASASLSGLGALSAVPLVETTGTAVLTGTGLLLAAGEVEHPLPGVVEGSAALAGKGLIVVNGLYIPATGAKLSGQGQLVSVGFRGIVGSAALDGTGSLVAQAIRLIATSEVQLSGLGSLEVEGTRGVAGKALLIGIGKLIAVPSVGAISAFLIIVSRVNAEKFFADASSTNLVLTDKELTTVLGDRNP